MQPASLLWKHVACRLGTHRIGRLGGSCGCAAFLGALLLLLAAGRLLLPLLDEVLEHRNRHVPVDDLQAEINLQIVSWVSGEGIAVTVRRPAEAKKALQPLLQLPYT